MGIIIILFNGWGKWGKKRISDFGKVIFVLFILRFGKNLDWGWIVIILNLLVGGVKVEVSN